MARSHKTKKKRAKRRSHLDDLADKYGDMWSHTKNGRKRGPVYPKGDK